MSVYQGYFLCRTKGLQNRLMTKQLHLQPGAPFPTPLEDEILLAGGFVELNPDSLFPLSPTLQLNGDCGSMPEEKLRTLALAELNRFNNSRFRSYRVEADSRVTVLAGDGKQLHEFVERYGGVLDISCLLIGAFYPGFDTASELTVTDVEDACQLDFTVRSPIDTLRCSSCGLCGAHCPETAINTLIEIDFSRCSECGECVTLCPQEAIDLHAHEERRIKSPALLNLDEKRISMPTGKLPVYTLATLPQLFSSIYDRQIDEVMAWSSAGCQYSPQRDNGCRLCFDHCSSGAIALNSKGVVIDQLVCVECGDCAGICPTGAVRYLRFDDTSFVEYFRTVDLQPQTTVVIGSSESLHEFWWYGGKKTCDQVFFLEYPIVRALSPMHLLMLYAIGASRIFILDKDGPGPDLNLVSLLLDGMFKRPDAVQALSPSQLARQLPNPGLDNPLSCFYRDWSFGGRRRKLADLLQFLYQQSTGEKVFVDASSAGITGMGTIACDESICSHCGACVGECRSGALTIDSSAFLLRHQPALCIGCGSCAAICPERALHVLNTVELSEDFFNERTIASAEPLSCKRCGKVFGTRKSLDKVISILSARNLLDQQGGLLHYCDECRVIRIFEENVS